MAPPGFLSRSKILAVLLPSRALDFVFACFAALGALGRFLAGVAFFAFPLAGATRGFCARTLAFLGGSPETRAVSFVSAMSLDYVSQRTGVWRNTPRG